jgi:catechol 2,3-dioxygenase-like lactoylglutathione lyase family enzyme
MFTHNDAFSGFSVDNIDTAVAFYQDTLGLPVEKDEYGGKITLGNGHSVYMYPKENHVPATYTMLNFMVDDIQKAADMLAEKGIMLEKYEGLTDEHGIAWGKKQNKGPNIAWFLDPAKNILAIVEK